MVVFSCILSPGLPPRRFSQELARLRRLRGPSLSFPPHCSPIDGFAFGASSRVRSAPCARCCMRARHCIFLSEAQLYEKLFVLPLLWASMGESLPLSFGLLDSPPCRRKYATIAVARCLRTRCLPLWCHLPWPLERIALFRHNLWRSGPSVLFKSIFRLSGVDFEMFSAHTNAAPCQDKERKHRNLKAEAARLNTQTHFDSVVKTLRDIPPAWLWCPPPSC